MMSIEVRLICCVLATWRITHLLVTEDGPGDVVVRLRASLGQSVLGRAMDCFYCLSVWVAAPLAPFVSTDPLEWAFTWLALSGGACLLERATAPGLALPPTDRAMREGGLDELLWTAPRGDPFGDAAHTTAGPGVVGTSGGADSHHLSR